MTTEEGWFARLDSGEHEAAITAVRSESASVPEEWPALAVESGFAESESEYYETLRAVTIEAARRAVTERERADDQQLIHAVRAMDDIGR